MKTHCDFSNRSHLRSFDWSATTVGCLWFKTLPTSWRVLGLPSVLSLGCSSPVCSSLICLRHASSQTPLRGPRISKTSAFTIVCLEPTDPVCSLERFRGKTFSFFNKIRAAFEHFTKNMSLWSIFPPFLVTWGNPILLAEVHVSFPVARNYSKMLPHHFWRHSLIKSTLPKNPSSLRNMRFCREF